MRTIITVLLCVAGALAQQTTVVVKAAVATPPCMGTPGNTTDSYRSLCQTSAGLLYACNNPAGCTVSSDWVGQASPTMYCEDTGSLDDYACDVSPAPSAYIAGRSYRFKANTANTGPATINFNSLGAVAIKKATGGIETDLSDDDIRSGQMVDLVFDGTNMQMQSASGNAPGGGTGGLGFTAENAANKDVDATLAANSDTKYPSQKAVKAYVDAQVINAKNHGAKGDGSTDDTDSVQMALNSVSATGTSRVVFPCGTYITRPLTYKSNTIIEGEGGRCAILKIKPGLTLSPNAITLLSPAAVSQTGNVIRNIVIDQSSGDGQAYTIYNSNQPAISVNYTIGMRVENVEFRNVMTMAVWAHSGSADGLVTKDLTLNHNQITNSMGGGMSVFGNIQNIAISENQIQNTKDDAIAIQYDYSLSTSPNRVVIDHNIIHDVDTRNAMGSTPHCILIFGSVTNFSVADNICDKSVASGIHVTPDDAHPTLRPVGGSITGNVVDRAGVTSANTNSVPGAGIRISGSDDISVADNTIRRSREQGIAVVSSTNVSLTGNVLSNNAGGVISVQSSQRVTQSGNSGGFQHVRVNSCQTSGQAAGETCDTDVYWPVPFPSKDYTVNCTTAEWVNASRAGGAVFKTPAYVRFRIESVTGSPVSAEIDCTAVYY